MAVQLASQYFFGKAEMAASTASTLDTTKMDKIKAIVTAKFGPKRSAADKEAIWSRCKTVTGQKCKAFRHAQKADKAV